MKNADLINTDKDKILEIIGLYGMQNEQGMLTGSEKALYDALVTVTAFNGNLVVQAMEMSEEKRRITLEADKARREGFIEAVKLCAALIEHPRCRQWTPQECADQIRSRIVGAAPPQPQDVDDEEEGSR